MGSVSDLDGWQQRCGKQVATWKGSNLRVHVVRDRVKVCYTSKYNTFEVLEEKTRPRVSAASRCVRKFNSLHTTAIFMCPLTSYAINNQRHFLCLKCVSIVAFMPTIIKKWAWALWPSCPQSLIKALSVSFYSERSEVRIGVYGKFGRTYVRNGHPSLKYGLWWNASVKWGRFIASYGSKTPYSDRLHC